jgi:hypothetical protein
MAALPAASAAEEKPNFTGVPTAVDVSDMPKYVSTGISALLNKAPEGVSKLGSSGPKLSDTPALSQVHLCSWLIASKPNITHEIAVICLCAESRA